ncbi:MAG: Smr/MutS family protein [Bacteroidota bacterium]
MVSILAGGALKVEDTHGFSRILSPAEVVPVLVEQEIASTKSKTVEPPRSQPAERDITALLQSEQDSILLEFLPTDSNQELKVILFNASGWSTTIVCSKLKGDLHAGSFQLLVPARAFAELGRFKLDDFSATGGIELRFLFFRTDDHRPQEPVSKRITLSPTECRAIFQSPSPDVPPGILKPLLVMRDVSEDIGKLLDKFTHAPATSSSTSKTQSSSHRKLRSGKERVIDLHIESLTEYANTVSPGQIIAQQLATFEKEMDRAHMDHLDRIIFIHGIGSGILKSAIREALKNYENVNFGDAAFERFGRGATQVDFL